MKSKTFIWLIMGGMTVAYFSIKYRNPILIFLIMGGLGIFGIVSGMQMILTRRANTPTNNSLNTHNEHYDNPAVRLYGVLLTLFGIIVVLIALSITIFKSASEKWIAVSFSNSQGMGLFLAGAGLLMSTLGVIRLMTENEAYRETKLGPFERTADGIYFSILGISILTIGIWIALSPSSLRAILESISAFFQKIGPE